MSPHPEAVDEPRQSPSPCCKDARVVYLPDGRTRIPCSCVPDLERWQASRIPPKYLDAPLSTLKGEEIPRSRFLYGEPGRGKTRAAVGILKRFARRSFGGVFLELVALEGQRRNAVSTGEEPPGEEFFSAPFLVADDLLRNVRVTDFWAEYVIDLVRSRYNANLPTVWTSNFPLDQVAQTFGDWVAGRIGESCGPRVFEVSGPDWRRCA